MQDDERVCLKKCVEVLKKEDVKSDNN